MSKTTFNKLNLKMNQNVKSFEFQDQIVNVKQYLPINDKLALISRVLNQASDENNFSNPLKLEMFGKLEIVFAYTDISFTDKQKEDMCKLYDILYSSNFLEELFKIIPKSETIYIEKGIKESSDAIYTYRNSVLGLLDIISTDYSNLNLDASEIQKKLADPDNMALLRGILDKLG